MPARDADQNRKAVPPPPPGTPKSPPSKPLANTLMDDITDKRPAMGRGTPIGIDQEPDETKSPSVPVERGPEREKHKTDRKP